MKLIDRVAPALESVALAALGAALAWLALSGRYGSFVPPTARPGILASSAGLLACSLAQSSRLGSGGDRAPASGSSRGITRALAMLVTAVVLVLPFRVSPSELASSALSAHPGTAGVESGADSDDSASESAPEPSPGAEAGAGSGAPGGSQGGASPQATLELTTDNFAAQIEELTTRGKAHDGQRVELTGFVMSEASARGQAAIPRLAQGDSFAVARMAIWCCAADAYAIGFAVRWDGPVPETDGWVRVSGTLRLRGGKALVIEAESVEATSAPDPEFVVQTR